MIRRILIILIFSLIITSCGGAAPAESPVMDEPTAPIPTNEPSVSTQGFSSDPIETASPISLPTEILPTLTETPLPPIEMPALLPNAPSLLAWDGTPTYLGDSLPGYDFRVMYDPNTWALTEDQFGYPAVAHREIEYCTISVTSGRGLPANLSVEQDILYADKVTFYVGTAFENDVKKFVTYTGGDGKIITGFMVSFDDQSDQCLADAVTVITTLRSVPVSLATPEQ